MADMRRVFKRFVASGLYYFQALSHLSCQPVAQTVGPPNTNLHLLSIWTSTDIHLDGA